ncbi:unnamed protein product [Kuraishia capsulata CBS 1993]|uniref:Uncharacterized protein n=1 Tax=Kuraishia capsulata CBS 1993 TaxID=1382522 RepID=W6MLH0_9ASCO|nr:uncharacterized protein KUCA_T00003332001 [Kuraishia capsulata CBS 1993]CDK27354.1 unnamed protein product [Kuraishia capsulata CBS 1993]
METPSAADVQGSLSPRTASNERTRDPRSPGSLQIRQQSVSQSPRGTTPETDPNATVLKEEPLTPVYTATRPVMTGQTVPKLPVLTNENALGSVTLDDPLADSQDQADDRVQAYAMLDFAEFTFYVQTMQVLLGRLVDGDTSTEALDIHLGPTKAISRKHARIFYNFGTQRFELSVLGRNGAFVDDVFVETGVTLPLKNRTRIQIGEIHFRFVLPAEETFPRRIEALAKPINATDAVNLKAALYNTPTSKSRSNSAVEIKDEVERSPTPKVPLLTPIPPYRHAPQPQAQYTTASQLAALQEAARKKEKAKKQAKPVKKVYTLEEIPVEFRAKPACSYSTLIESCLRARGTEKGMSLSEIYRGIQDLYPYYKYCSDGWQSSVRHNLSLNKSFKKVSKEGKGWLWGLDEEYCAERDKVKTRASVPTPAPNPVPTQSQQSAGKTELEPMIPPLSQQSVVPQTQPQPTLRADSTPAPGTLSAASLQSAMAARGKSIAELASEIKRETPKPQPSTSIQAQLAANRAQYAKSQPSTRETSSSPQPGSSVSPPAASGTVPVAPTNPKGLSGDTMKALGYLQQELIKLTKDRKMNDKQTTTAILTQALAMTIAQVNQAARNAGIQGNPLASLIEKNPQHVTKILTAALNAATAQVMKGKPQPHKAAQAPAPAATPVAAPVPVPHQQPQTARPVALSPKPQPASVAEAKPPMAPNAISQGIRKPQYYSRPPNVSGSGAGLKKPSGLNPVKPPVSIAQPSPQPQQSRLPPQADQSVSARDAEFDNLLKSISREATPDDRDTPPMSEKELDDLLNQHSSFVRDEQDEGDIMITGEGLKRPRDDEEDILMGLENKMAKVD